MSGLHGILLGIYRDNGKENGNYYRVWGLGFMEKKETTIVGYDGVYRVLFCSCQVHSFLTKDYGSPHSKTL